MLQHQCGAQTDQATTDYRDVTHSACHQGFDLDRLARQGIGQDFVSLACNQHVVLDSNPNIPPFTVHASTACRYINAGFYRHDHARFEQSPLIPDFVVTDVMDIGDGARPGRGRKRLDRVADKAETYEHLSARELNARLKKLENDMYEHARNLEFEEAARLRDEIASIKDQYFKTSELEIA